MLAFKTVALTKQDCHQTLETVTVPQAKYKVQYMYWGGGTDNVVKAFFKPNL